MSDHKPSITLPSIIAGHDEVVTEHGYSLRYHIVVLRPDQLELIAEAVVRLLDDRAQLDPQRKR